MEVQAITKNVRMSAQKMREVVRQIQGLPALRCPGHPRRDPAQGRPVGRQDPHSAMANAEDLKTHHKEYSGMNTEKPVGQGSRGPDRHHLAPVYPQGSRFRRPDPQAQLPY